MTDSTSTTSNATSAAACKKVVRFAMDETVVHVIPCVTEEQAPHVWWQPAELQAVKNQIEQQVEACRAYLTCSPTTTSTHPSLTQLQTYQAIQGLVGCTRQLLMSHQRGVMHHNRNPHRIEHHLLMDSLCQAMQRTAVLRGLEARLVPACRQVVQEHIRQVLRHRGGCEPSYSQRCVLLAQVRARYDAG